MKAARENNSASDTPSLRDFSRRAVDKAVLRESLSHPLTTYPLALAFLGGLAALLFGSPVFAGVALGGLFTSAASGIVNLFFRNRALSDRYLTRLRRAQEKHEAEVLQSLKGELEQCRDLGAVQKQAAHGLEQFDRARDKFQNVRDLLESKITTGELAYSRFISTAQQVYLSVLDNLKQAAAVMRSAGTIDPAYVSRRLKELHQEQGQGTTQEQETLEERLQLLKDQLAQVERLLAANEKAMTSLENTTSTLAALDTHGRFATTDFDTAMAYLQELGRGAPELSKSPPNKEEVEA